MATTQNTGCGLSFPPREILMFIGGTVLLTTMFLVAYNWPVYLGVAIGAFGLMVHELAHKVAGRWRCISNTHFVISPLGVVLGFGTSLLLGHTLAAPGGVTVGEGSSKNDKLIMALAGPVSNLLIFGIFIILHVTMPYTIQVNGLDIPLFESIALVNLYLGFFNLLPIPMFDGSHIFRFNKVVWGGTFLISLILMLVMWNDIGVALVPLFEMSTGGVINFSLVGPSSRFPLFPGLVLMATDAVHVKNWLFRSVLDDTAKTIG